MAVAAHPQSASYYPSNPTVSDSVKESPAKVIEEEIYVKMPNTICIHRFHNYLCRLCLGETEAVQLWLHHPERRNTHQLSASGTERWKGRQWILSGQFARRPSSDRLVQSVARNGQRRRRQVRR